jgi:CheY-like chemotaxis protein
MKMIVERIMGWESLYVLQNSANFIEWTTQIGVVPDLFLLDIQMEPYDGFELLSMLRGNPRFGASKVIAVTASVMSEQVARLKQSGFDGAIAKPLSIDVFPGLLEKVLTGESVWHIA